MREKIRALACFNAIQHDGKAELNAVISKVISLYPEQKGKLKELIPLTREIIEEVNSLPREEMVRIVESEMPELLEPQKKEEKRLPDLPGVDQGGVVMRLAPSPSGPLHIGHARMAILNDEYFRRYGGRLILRIEDTNPANIDPEAYEMIKEDLKWLEVNYTDVVIQSDRFPLYYDEMKRLIESGNAYVATTPSEEFKSRKQKGVPIKEREESAEDNLERWDRMLSGYYAKGEAYAVVKTDLNHPNPAVRDFIAFRIIDIPHPLKGDRYRVYPMMNFSVAIDDHHLGLTHVIRGKDHIANTEKQRYIFSHMGWKRPYYIHYGKVSIEHSILKTSLIKKGIRNGEFSGWDDPRLGTLIALKKRGFSPAAIRRYYVESGIGDVDTTFSWEIFYSFNRKIIDQSSPRHFFVKNPVRLNFNFDGKLKARIPLFPNKTSNAFREYEVRGGEIVISEDDYRNLVGNKVRLKDLGLFRIGEGDIQYLGDSLDKGIQIIHWLYNNYTEFTIKKPDGSVDIGLIEKDALNYIGRVNQLERYGYVNIINEKEGYFTHP
ncbi:MAG: glutamate--tRNA ligase [Thermoplasmatales archaeon]